MTHADTAAAAVLARVFAADDGGGDDGGGDPENNPLAIWLDGDSLAPFRTCNVPTALAALAAAQAGPDDVVADIGCGDGRIVCAAAAVHGCRRAYGVDIEDDVVELAQRKAAALDEALAAGGLDPVGERVRFECGDALTMPFADATVLALYLLPEGLELIRPVVERVLGERKGARAVSIRFPFADWEPVRVVHTDTPAAAPLYVYSRSDGDDPATE